MQEQYIQDLKLTPTPFTYSPPALLRNPSVKALSKMSASPPPRTQKSGSISSIGSTSSSESAPLDNFTGVSNALAHISEQEDHLLPGANGETKVQRRPSMEDTEEAIRKYKGERCASEMTW